MVGRFRSPAPAERFKIGKPTAEAMVRNAFDAEVAIAHERESSLPTLLLVDDAPANRLTLGVALDALVATVVTASTEEALQQDCAAVLLDVQLPQA